MKAALRALAPLAALSALLVAGCAQDVGDIVRVQPNFVKKSDFDGQWYIRNTIVDVPPQVNFMFKGYTLQMEKVCWEISEDYLIGYRSYELHPGKNPEVDHDGKEIGNTQPDEYDEYRNQGCYKDAPIVAYRIQNHFDIQRQYNPATGEQTNVIVENGNDRPWYERQFMRVDWSKNNVTNFTGDVDMYAGPGTFDFTNYVQESEGGDWAFRMETAAGEPVALDPNEPDVFKQLFAENREAPAYFDVTQRMYLAAPTFEYYGRKYPSCWLMSQTVDCTGGEVKMRTSVLKVPEERTFLPRVYDDVRMGKFGYFRTERLTYDRQYGHTDSGKIFLANVHNLWETAFDADGNVLPAKDRTPKPVVYHLSPNFPEELIPETEEVAKGWAKAFTRAVAAAQNTRPEVIAEQFPYEDENGNYVNEGLFRIDYNPDGEATIGDLRYNFFYWVDSPHQRSPLGYGPSDADPETGELIAAQAYVYGASLDVYARRSLDQVRAINGDLDVGSDVFQDGDYIRDYLAGNRDRVDPRFELDLLGKLDSLDRPLEEFSLENINPEGAARLEAIRQFGLDDVQETLHTRMERVKGTDVEPLLINDEIRNVLAVRTGNLDFLQGAMDQDLIEGARSLTFDGVLDMQAYEDRLDFAMNNNMWFAEYNDSAVEGLAKHIAEQGMSDEEAYQFLRKRIYQGVMEHEIGHTVGLRHNFQGSHDAINYHDEYWDLRKENVSHLDRMQSMSDILAMSEQTPAQIDGRMREYQYSSIMDYGARFNSDFHGLGKYDEAAILFGYSDFVEVYENPGNEFKERYFQTYSDGTPRFEQTSLAYTAFLEATHYTQVPFLMGDGTDTAALERGIERNKQRRVIPYQQMIEDREAEDPGRWVEVPYMFCTDEWRGAINSCQLWDMGADLYEQTQVVKEGWLNNYWFNNYRRDRHAWDPYNTFQTSYSRYFSYISNFWIHWVFNYINGHYDEGLASFYSQVAVYEGFNFLIDVLTMPEYGSYEYLPSHNMYVRRTTGLDWEEADAVVPVGEGRRGYSRWDYDGLYYYQYPKESGHFFDFLAALLAVSESRGTFRGVDTQSDFGSYILPYYLLFPEELSKVFNGIILDDVRDFAPRMVQGQTGQMHMVQPPAVDWMGIIDEEFERDLPVVAGYDTRSATSGFSGDRAVVGWDNLPQEFTSPTSFTWSERIYALLFGTMGFTSQYTLDYPDEHRIFRVGTGETLEPVDGYELVEFSDLNRGMKYAALRDPNAERDTAAVKLLSRMNALQAEREALLVRAGDDTLTNEERAMAEAAAQDLYYEIDSLVNWADIERRVGELWSTSRVF